MIPTDDCEQQVNDQEYLAEIKTHMPARIIGKYLLLIQFNGWGKTKNLFSITAPYYLCLPGLRGGYNVIFIIKLS